MKKRWSLSVLLLLQLLLSSDILSQDYSFPITDLLPYIRHNPSDSVCALHNIPQRGTIFDRNRKMLASDSILYDLMVRPGKVKQQDTAIICSLLKISRKEFRDRLKYARNWSDPAQPLPKRTSDQPAPFKGLLSKEITRIFQKKLPELQPAFSLKKRPVRHYPFNTAAHLLGYIKAGGIGETGLEESYDHFLRGTTGLQFWTCDHRNTPSKRWAAGSLDVMPEKGKDLYTTIDLRLQLMGEKLMQGKRGSIVAIDPQTGGILAMISSPAYSPVKLALDRNAYYPALRLNKDKPLLNRAISSYNAPGSAFKLFQALVALQLGVADPYTTFVCKGSYTLCGNPPKPKCHVEGAHQPNLVKALAISCNSYFADLFRKMIGPFPGSGLSQWAELIKHFGFGTRTGIDLPGEKAGMVPDTTLYKLKYRSGWNSCTILSNAIGQGEVSATVLQLANAIAIVAGKGWFYQPHIVDSIAGIPGSSFLAGHQKINAFVLPDSSWNLVHRGMYEAVNTKAGTAYNARVNGLEICGKTGTVENGKGEKDHAVFAAFAPRSRPRIAIVCLVENGGFGAQVAAPVVTQLIKQYLSNAR
ncbi:peptidoglycan D,D-transpeptidase FtsI family protein [Filimonas effusa]|uniref:Penicillin-binding protein 2 n=1 Tax=Filimonas effusa TaxID=2508721 RepID=A0A4Q1DBC1_9BACT|nr:penicillin-binding transpeptidase domain-containing protein [Filimonas effusa]RXK86208.1 penicillin-binding protein 2 [Filimonas effusa]